MEMWFAVAGCLRGELMACDRKGGGSFFKFFGGTWRASGMINVTLSGGAHGIASLGPEMGFRWHCEAVCLRARITWPILLLLVYCGAFHPLRVPCGQRGAVFRYRTPGACPPAHLPARPPGWLRANAFSECYLSRYE
ncbi:uncharacterized [Tachysurus ichikawai]